MDTHSDITTAGDGLTPLEAAMLDMDRDLRTALAGVEQLKAQATAFEAYLRAMTADFTRMRLAMK